MMCGYRSHHRERYLSSPRDGGDSDALHDQRPVSESERDAALAALRRHAAADRLSVKEFGQRSDEALAATSRAELYAALRDLPASDARGGGLSGRHAGPFGPLPLLPIVAIVLVVLLVASHGWFIFPLAWLLFAVLRPWGRRRRHFERPPVTRF